MAKQRKIKIKEALQEIQKAHKDICAKATLVKEKSELILELIEENGGVEKHSDATG